MRYDVKIVFTQEFSLATEAETAAKAQQLAVATMHEGVAESPDRTDLHVVVEKGVA